MDELNEMEKEKQAIEDVMGRVNITPAKPGIHNLSSPFREVHPSPMIENEFASPYFKAVYQSSPMLNKYLSPAPFGLESPAPGNISPFYDPSSARRGPF